MAAAITFFAMPTAFAIQSLSGSGLGFYGDSGFGASVAVGNYQGRTFVTNSAGSAQGIECNNVKYLNAGSGILGQTGSGIALTAIPNSQATLAIDFTYDTPVKTQNARVNIFDRSNPNNPASGVTTKIAELIHPSITQLNNGSGDTTWITPAGSGVTVSLCPSPGVSGLYAGNGNDGGWTDTRHTYYLAISSSPDSIGSKSNFGLFFYVEYM
jgi:hypothetical protein